MAGVKAEPAAAPSIPASLGWRLLFGGIGMALGLTIGMGIWAFDVLTKQHHDYTMTGLALMIILGGIGFFVAPAKNGWRDTFLYFLLLGFLDN